MHNFTPWSALLGGLLIGLSASIMLILHGRVAGITGIVSGSIVPQAPPAERRWRGWFLLGLVGAAGLLLPWLPEQFDPGVSRSLPMTAIAGALVGFGTRMGSGCTSGHGVCGLSRRSPRSAVATVTFIVSGMITVAVFRGLS